MRRLSVWITGVLLGSSSLLTAANFSWNGSASADWFNAANWTPNGVPGSNDTINIAGGNITLSSPVVVGGQLNWSGGTLGGNPLTIATNGVLNITGGGGVSLSTILTNAGTVNWSNSVSISINNNGTSYTGGIYNLPGALFNIASDQSMYANYCCSFLNNAGMISKAAKAGTTSFNIALTNSGTVTALAGSMNFNGGGDLDGTFTAGVGASINFNGGSFRYDFPPVLNGPGQVRLSGGSLVLVSNTIPNLQLTGGTVSLSADFQGGSISNLVLAGANLSGRYLVTGALTCGGGVNGSLLVTNGGALAWTGGNISGDLTLADGAVANWSGGTAFGPVHIAANGVLNVVGGGGVGLSAPLTNAGTLNWSNSVSISVNNNAGSYSGAIYNLAGALFNIECDQPMYGNYCCPFLNNAGTISKGANSGITSINLPFTNNGTVVALAGSISFNGGGDLDGAFTAQSGASINFNGGPFEYDSPPVVNGPGLVRLTGGSLTLVSNTIPNLQLTGGTVSLGADFQGGVITNLVVAGANLSGNYLVTGALVCGGGVSGSLLVTNGASLNWTGGNITGELTLADGAVANWTGGTAFGPVNIAANGVLNVIGGGGVGLSAPLTNSGTLNWSNSVSISVNNNAGSYSGAIYNLAGALFNIECDQPMYGNYCCPFLNNAGTISKGANNGTTSFNVVCTNSGTVIALAGSINFNGGGDLSGAFTAAAGTAINFNSGNFVYSVPPVLTGPGVVRLTGGSLSLVSNTIPNLQLTGGTVRLSPNFQDGAITNLIVAGANLSGNYLVTGYLDCAGGVSGSLEVAGGGLLNWTGGNISGGLALDEGAVLNWTGGTVYGAVTVATNGVMNIMGGGSVGVAGPLTNAGTINWSNSVSLYVENNHTPQYDGAIYNLPGALFNIESDQGLNGSYCCPFFNNAGTVSKGAGTGTTSVNVGFTNTGIVTALKGTINFNSGGDLEGTFTAVSGTAINFNGGNFGYGTVPTLNGPGAIQFTGGSLQLSDNIIPGLSLIGGTINVPTNFQGGTITNLTSQANLTGNYVVSGVFNCGGGVSGSLVVTNGGVLNFSGGTITGSLTLTPGAIVNWSGGNISGALQVPDGAMVNWSGGTVYGPVTVATNGTINLVGGSSVGLAGPLTNAGTINWSNSVSVYVENNHTAQYDGAIYNLPGALFNIESDQGLNGSYCCPFFNNSGTISKGANSGTTSINVAFTNSGVVTVLAGAINFNGGGDVEGAFTASAGAAINFNGGNFVYASVPALSGAGTVQLTGGTMALLDNVVPNLGLAGGTITLASNFQGGTITNLTSRATLNGNFTVSGIFNSGGGVNGSLMVTNNAVLNFTGGTIIGNLTLASGSAAYWSGGNISGAVQVPDNALLDWSGGTVYGAVNVGTNGEMDITGGGSVGLAGPLTNSGTINWSNTVSVYVENNNTAQYDGAIFNLPAGRFHIASDQGLNGSYCCPFLNNAGTVTKTTTTGTTTFNVAVTNSGLLDIEAGTLTFNSGLAQSGAWAFGINGPGNNGQAHFPGSVVLTGPVNVNLNNGYIPALNSSFSLLTYGSETGAFTSTNLPNDGLSWRLQYGPNAVTVAVINYDAPVVTITNPASGAAFIAPAAITLGATVTDQNAAITNVEFFQGTNLVGQATTAPYTIDWNNVPAGFYSVSARATDAVGATALSAPVNINVYSAVNPSTNFFWTGAVSSDWFTPGNWNPAGVPGALDVVNITNGNVTLSSSLSIAALHLSAGTVNGNGVLTVTNSITWTGGTVAVPLTIPAGAVLNLDGNNTLTLANTLTNGGTVNWIRGGFMLNNCSSQIGIVNLAGATWNIACDQNIYLNCGGPGYFLNLGTVQKSVTGGTTSFSVPLLNLGEVAGSSGTINFNDGGTLAGNMINSSGAVVNFAGGNFTAAGGAASGPGSVRFTGGTLTLTNDVIPGLALTGGTLVLGPGFQGGSVTNLTLSGSTLSGAHTVSGTLNWNAGAITGPLNVAAAGVLNLQSGSTKTLYNSLTNAGTVNWLGGTFSLDSCSGSGGPVINLPSAAWNVLCDQTLSVSCSAANAYFWNYGLLQKSGSTGTTYISTALVNAGQVSALSGTLNFNGGGAISGNFAAAAGAAIDFSAGSFVGAGSTITGPGPVRFNGGNLVLTNDIVSNLKLTAGTLSLGPGFQGGVITNLTLSGITLSGSNTIAGTLDWRAGSIGGTVFVAPTGRLNLDGPGTMYLAGALTNAGTVNWAGGVLTINSCSSQAGPIANLGGGTWNILCDQTLNQNCSSTNGYFQNFGTVEKSGTRGTTTISIPFYNAGGLGLLSGTVNFNGNPGYAQTGATMDFGISSLSTAGHVSISGNANFDGTLQVEAFNGFTPQTGDALSLASYGSVAGQFGALALPRLSPGQAWQLAYTANILYLQAISSAGFNQQITGAVTDSLGHGVTNITVFAYTTNRLAWYVSSVTDSNGHYSLPVTNGTWLVGLSGLPVRGYNDVPSQMATANNSNPVVNFTLQPFTGEKFTITTAVRPPGAGTASGAGSFFQGSTVTVTATPTNTIWPYLFASWTENGVFESGSSSYSFTASRDRNLVANFTLPLYTITATNNPAGAGSVTGTGSCYYGATNVVTASPVFGYSFNCWTEGTNVLGSNATLVTIVYTNHAFTANYSAINLLHTVATATQPAGLAPVTGAGAYTNGQAAQFSAPPALTNSPYVYTFQYFTLSNSVVSYSPDYSKTFSTLDPTNLLYVAVYRARTILPTLTRVTANLPNPIPATTNLVLALQFDRTMSTNVPPGIVLTNSAAAVQPIVLTNGYWTSSQLSTDTYVTPPITIIPGMDGTLQLFVSGAADLNGNQLALTNPTSFTVQATPPPNPTLALVASNSSSATLSWSGYVTPPHLSGFRVYVQKTNFNSTATLSPLAWLGAGARSFQVFGLNLDTPYYAAVQAFDNVGNSSPAVTVLPFELPSSMPPPVTLQEMPVGASSALLSWSNYNSAALLGLSGFRIYEAPSKFTSVTGLTPLATVDATQVAFTVNALDRHQTYYFAVVGFNDTNGFDPNVSTASWSDPYAGVITSDTTIGGPGSSVVPIYQSIIVSNGATLAVLPGTTLSFAPGTGLTVQEGKLIANGTALAPVVFDSANDTSGGSPAAGDWAGITLGSAAGGSSLNFVTLFYSGGLIVDGCNPTVQALTAQHNFEGLLLRNEASLTTSNALLSFNGIGAQQQDTATLTIQNSVLQDNDTNAWASGAAALSATSNWWGSTSSATIAPTLQGNVAYSPFLTYAPLLTPAIGTVGGVTQVGSPWVNLQLACRTATGMRLSEDYSFSGVFFVPFTNVTTFPLSSGGGLKHIFAQFRSVTGQTNTPLELDLTYITAGPVIHSFSLNQGQTLSRPLTVTGSATATLGMQDIEFYWDGVPVATNAGGNFSYYFDVRSQNNATHQAELLARDTAGNIATLEETVVVALTPPLAPVLLSPSADYVTNNNLVSVRGTAEPNMSLQITDNGQVLAVTNADANGNFSVPAVTLSEGANTLVAVAYDNTGTTPSAPRHVTVETIPPAALTMNAPVYTPGLGLTLSWSVPPSGKVATVFRLFWSTNSFSSTSQAMANSGPLTVLVDTLRGLTPGTYYFGVVGYDAAGNASPLSGLVSTNYDPIPPSLAVAYSSAMPVGTGPLTITLGSSKALAGTPSLTIRPAGAPGPVLLSLTNVALNTWQTVLPVTTATPSGTATVQVTAQDLAGNVFQGAPSGPLLSIDTTPPIGAIVTVPPGPVKTVNGTNVTVSLTLTKAAGPGTTPTLSFQPPTGSSVPVTLSGSASNWNGVLALTSAMGSGFGVFNLSAGDSLGNVGTTIASGDRLELYNTALPSPPAAPLGLRATSLPGGYVNLTWNSVSNAQIYRLYRDFSTNVPGTLVADNITSNNVTDLPSADGVYSYGVTASRLGSESGISNIVLALSDRVPPLAPTNVSVTLAVTGVQISWEEPAGAETPDHYNIYRNGVLIRSATALAPVTDFPPRGTNTYVVAAVDTVGNSSASSPVALELLVSPVNNLAVQVIAGQAPRLSWSSSDSTVTGFNIYRNGVKQNAALLTGTSYLDSLALLNSTSYGVTAVNGSGQESPQRLVTVSPVSLGLLANGNNPLLVHYFDQIQVTATNGSSATALPLAQLVLSRAISGQPSLTVTQALAGSISPGAGLLRSLVLPEAAVVANQVMTLQLFQQTDAQGDSVAYQQSFVLTNSQLPGTELTLAANQVPLAGGLNAFQVQLFNHGYTDIQLVVSRGFNAHPGDLSISVQNNLGQEVGRTAFQGTPPGTTFLGDGTGYVNIAAGASLAFTVPNVLVPAALDGATNVAFVAVASTIYHDLGTSTQVASGPLSGSMVSPSLALPPYYGTAQTDRPAYVNDQPVIITGQAISQTNGLPLPSAALNIGFATRGYKWFQSVTTDTNGNYSFTFYPPPGFGGSLMIWAAHPLVVDQLNQAPITIYRLYATPNAEDIQMSKNGTIHFSVKLINPGDTPLTALSTSFSAYQVAGTNRTPISTITGTNLNGPSFTLAAGQSQSVELQLAADINAPDTAQIDFTLTSAEGAAITITGTVDLFPAVPVLTVVSPASGYLEASLNRGDQVSGQITFMNSGLDTLRGLTLTPPTNVTWMSVNAPLGADGLVHLPDLPVGQSNTFSVVFYPPATTDLSLYQDKVVLRGSNLNIPYSINVYALVTSDQTGGVQFEVDDILGQQVSGASIRLHNDALRMDAGPVMTDTNGFVTITNLQGGSWNWEVTAPGCSASVGTVTVIPDQVVYQHTRLSRSLVTVSFSVVPVPFSDQYQLQVEQTFETYVPAGVLVLDPAAQNFNNVTPGFQASFVVNAKNYGLVQMTDVTINGSQSGQAAFSPLINYIPVLLPQQTVSVPMVFTYGANTTATNTGPTRLGLGDIPGCISGAFMGAFGFSDLMNPDTMGGLAAIFAAKERCVKDLDPQTAAATVAALYGVLQLANDFSDAASQLASAAASAIGCIIGNIFNALGLGIGGGGGGPSGGSQIIAQPVGCFPADTVIRMADGSERPIASLAVNDQVRSGSRPGDVSRINRVVELHADKLQEIELADACPGAPAHVAATAEHLFWVDGRGWTTAAKLAPGDYLFDAHEHRVRVVSNRVRPTNEKVYTLGLTGDTTFYANGVLVHDLCGRLPRAVARKDSGPPRSGKAVRTSFHPNSNPAVTQ